jgi:hypothetical protein
MKKRSKNINIQGLIILVLVLITVYLGYIYLYKAPEKTDQTNNIKQQPTSLPTVLTENINTNNWKLYKNLVYGFQFKFPNRFVAELPNGNERKILYAKGNERDAYIAIEDGKINTTDYRYHVIIKPFSGTLDELLYIDNIGGKEWWQKSTSDEYYSQEQYIINEEHFLKVKIVTGPSQGNFREVGYFYVSGKYGLVFSTDSLNNESNYRDQNDEVEKELTQIVSSFSVVK